MDKEGGAQQTFLQRFVELPLDTMQPKDGLRAVRSLHRGASCSPAAQSSAWPAAPSAQK